MINRKNNYILLLTLFVLHLPALLRAEEHVDCPGSHFAVHKEASVNIGESASITISNLYIESNISGKGKLILLSNNNAFIDANNNSIENLVLTAANKVELLSNLRIVNQLTILTGELHLNNFNLIIDPNTKLDQSTLEKIIQSGSGTILQQSIGIPYAATPFVFSGTVNFDFSQIPALMVSDKREAGENIFYYQTSFIPNRTNDVLAPPPKAA